VIIILYESRSDDDDILKLNPWLIVSKIILNQIGFYAIYLLITFSIDIASQEKFSVYQVFASIEFSFSTFRGLITGLCLILAMGFVSIILTGVVQTYKNMLDYCFTLAVFHFVVVSLVEQAFPGSGAWWTALGIGLLFSMIIAERLSYHLETMSYASHLSESEFKHKKRTKEVDLPKLDSDDTGQDSSKEEATPPIKKYKNKVDESDAIELPEIEPLNPNALKNQVSLDQRLSSSIEMSDLEPPNNILDKKSNLKLDEIYVFSNSELSESSFAPNTVHTMEPASKATGVDEPMNLSYKPETLEETSD